LAVRKFSGSYSQAIGRQELRSLLSSLTTKSFLPPTASSQEDSVKWSVAQYHPPFTIPAFRRNEIWVDLTELIDGDSEDVCSANLRALVEAK
jgi:hypothetical protein